MNNSMLIDDKTLNHVLEKYSNLNVKVVDRSFHLGVLMSTDSQLFLLRRIKYLSRTNRMLYESAFSDYLANRTFPAQRIMRTNSNSLVCRIEGETYFLTEFFEGIQVSDDEKKISVQIQEAGRMLAKLHRVSKSYMGPKIQRIPFHSRKVLHTLIKVSNKIQLSPKRDKFDLIALDVINQKLKFIEKNPFEFQSFLDINKMMNHGDYHAGNIVFDDNNVIRAVIDFEYCTDMPRIWDIVWALTWFGRKRRTEAFSGELDTVKLNTFLSAYDNEYPLVLQEKRAIIDLMISASFHATYFLVHYYLHGKLNANIEGCTTADEWLWITHHRETLTKVLF